MADRFERAVLGAGDRASTAWFQRSLHKKGLLHDRSVDAGWNLGLESMAINGVDCTEREKGGRLARGVGRVSGHSPVFVAVAGNDLFIQTYAGLFSTTAANVTMSRDVAESFELQWVNLKQREQAWYRQRVPQGNREHENSDLFTARFKAISAGVAQDIADRITELRDQRPVAPRRSVPPTRQPADDPYWYAVDLRVWEATARAIDAAADKRLAQFNNDAFALYDERLLRALGYLYAHLIVAKAGEDLLGTPTARGSVEQLALDLEPEWATFRMADGRHLAHALVTAILGKGEAAEFLEGSPRLEYMLVAAALLLRRLNRTSVDYRDRVAEMLRRNPVVASDDWFQEA